MKKITIILNNVQNFRKTFESEKTGIIYSVSCPIFSLYQKREEIDKILAINPRNQKKSSKPSKEMTDTLKDSPEMFIFRNLGITLIASEVNWDNKTNDLEITFDLDNENGLANGGHTYDVIKSFIGKVEEAEQSTIVADVRLDIITGENLKDEIINITEARNTSTQVREDSIMNSRGLFDIVKSSINEADYSENVSYYENQYVVENDVDSGYRQIKVSTILSYLMCFDLEWFDENTHPVIAYSSKKKVLDWYVKRNDSGKKDLEKFSKILPEILVLRDYIESSIPDIWNLRSGRFADQKGVRKLVADKKLDHTDYSVGYDIPNGYIYPILSAFRSILKRNSEGEYSFLVDPIKLFDEMNKDGKKSLVYKLINVTDKDPQTMGKSSELYDSCYGSLKGYYYEMKEKNSK